MKQQPGEPGRLTDVAVLRKLARQDVDKGAITLGYGADRDTVLRLLNQAPATEIVCTLRYRRHYFMAMHAEDLSSLLEGVASRNGRSSAARPG